MPRSALYALLKLIELILVFIGHYVATVQIGITNEYVLLFIALFIYSLTEAVIGFRKQLVTKQIPKSEYEDLENRGIERISLSSENTILFGSPIKSSYELSSITQEFGRDFCSNPLFPMASNNR